MLGPRSDDLHLTAKSRRPPLTFGPDHPDKVVEVSLEAMNEQAT